jgi:hypothetical protein
MKPFTRFALILAASAALPAFLSAQPPGGAVIGAPAPGVLSATGPGPRIQFNTENYAAGTNFVGDPIRYTFIVSNTGNETLVLSNVIPSCGCTTIGSTQPISTSGGGTVPSATTWTHEIAPGQTGVIPIQVATSNYRGQIAKTVKVVSNDRTRPNVTLQISAVLWQPIEVSPQPSAFFTISPDSTNVNNQVLKIFNRMDAPLDLSDPHSSTNVFTCALRTNVPGREFELTVTAAPPARLASSLSATIVQGEITLKCSSTNKPPTISVFETISPEITVFPTSIQLPAGPLVRPSTSHITIRENITNITLSDPSMSAPGVGVSMSVLQTNRTYVLAVNFPQDFTATAGQNITVKTDNPRFPTITVPVTPVPGMAQPLPAPVRLPAPAMPVQGMPQPPRPAVMIPPARSGFLGVARTNADGSVSTNAVTIPPVRRVFVTPPANATNTPAGAPVSPPMPSRP